MDVALSVSKDFKKRINEARSQRVTTLAQEPGRVTPEALPTRLELADMSIPNPNMRNILNTMRPVLRKQGGEPGPLMRNMKAHALLQETQQEFGETGVLARRVTATTIDIGQCNAQQQSHGFGIRTNQDLPGQKYEGGFRNGMFYGLGYLTFTNGERHEGMFANGLLNGQGKLFFTNGVRYEGTFANNRLNGQGKCFFTNGVRYEGMYVNGRLNGQSKFFFTNGNRLEGVFANGQLNGHGKYFFTNGDRYEGPIENFQRHGQGTMIYAGGNHREVHFDRGVEIVN